MTLKELDNLGRLLSAFLAMFADCFVNSSGRRLLAVYVKGQLSDVQLRTAKLWLASLTLQSERYNVSLNRSSGMKSVKQANGKHKRQANGKEESKRQNKRQETNGKDRLWRYGDKGGLKKQRQRQAIKSSTAFFEMFGKGGGRSLPIWWDGSKTDCLPRISWIEI